MDVVPTRESLQYMFCLSQASSKMLAKIFGPTSKFLLTSFDMSIKIWCDCLAAVTKYKCYKKCTNGKSTNLKVELAILIPQQRMIARKHLNTRKWTTIERDFNTAQFSRTFRMFTLQSNMAFVWMGRALATLLPTFTGLSRESIRSCECPSK